MKDINTTTTGNVATETDENGIATISFYHPAHNSLPGYLLKNLTDTITEVGNDSAVKVIILKSEGERTFCAGASFDELLTIENEEQGLVFFSGFAKVINACRKCPKLIIGRVQGKAIGGGVGMAAATDYCFGTQHAAIKLSELSIGIGPFVVGPIVERKIGLAAFSQLTINATAFKSAAWAQEKGLYAEVFETTEEMDKAIMQQASALASYNLEALAVLKKCLWEGTDHWDKLLFDRAAISGRLILSDYSKAALEKFKNR